MIKFPRRGNKKLFQDLLLLPAIIIVTLASVTVVTLQFQILASSISPLLLSSFTQIAFADHGQEAVLSLDNSTFIPLTLGSGNQVRVLADYTVQNSSIGGQTINAVMDLYTANGTLIKTSSYPSGFAAQNTNGTVELKTTVEDPSIQSLIANLTLTNQAKTEVISNEISTTIELQPSSSSQPSQQEGIEEEEVPQPTPSPDPQPTPSPEVEEPGIILPFG